MGFGNGFVLGKGKVWIERWERRRRRLGRGILRVLEGAEGNFDPRVGFWVWVEGGIGGLLREI